MRVQYAKWGNSLALRIPSAFAREVEAAEGKTVELSVSEGRLVVSPVEGPVYRLEDLVSGISADNRHDEVDTGIGVGHESRL